MSVSCVLPVHNEQDYLTYSLPRLLASPLNEIVVVLDRCTDNSEYIIKRYGDNRFKLIYKREQFWLTPDAESKSYGCPHANGDLILITDADVILDVEAVKKAVENLDSNPRVDLVCFTYKLYSLHGTISDRLKDEWMNLFAKVTRKLRIHPTRSGVYLARKKVVNIEDKPSEYDNLQQKCNVLTLETNTVHLRPTYNRKAQAQRGKARSDLPQYSLFKMILTCVLQFQPWMLLSYLRTRKR